MASKSMPSGASQTCGVASPSSGAAHGQAPYGCSPNHSVTPTGARPSARNGSWSVSPTVTTRSGRSVMTVSPYLCGMVTGYASPAGAGDPAAGDWAAAGRAPAPRMSASSAARGHAAARRGSCDRGRLMLPPSGADERVGVGSAPPPALSDAATGTRRPDRPMGSTRGPPLTGSVMTRQSSPNTSRTSASVTTDGGLALRRDAP